MKVLSFLIPALLLSLLVNSQSLTVTSPTGNDTLIGGQTYTLTWTTTGSIPMVNIFYKRNGVQYTIAMNEVNTGSYVWTVPGNILSTNNGYIRISSNASSINDQNDNPFHFLEAPKSFTLTYPNALTDTIEAGVPNIITWNWTGNMSKSASILLKKWRNIIY